jgi:hypothetical protein
MYVVRRGTGNHDPDGRAFFFPEVGEAEETLEAIARLVFKLGYHQHGGSGLGYQRSEVLAMPIAEAVKFGELLDEARSADARAVRKANRAR